MSENACLTGRLDLPFVGHCTSAAAPVCADWKAIASNVAVIVFSTH
jgi:agmatinase